MIVSKDSQAQNQERKNLTELFQQSPIPESQLLNHLQLFQRSSIIARILHLSEVYELILNQPGVILQFGVHWGSTMAVFQSLRGVYEPYNYSRKVVGFDEFSPEAAKERAKEFPGIIYEDKFGQFDGSSDYDNSFLKLVLDYHERENLMSHVKKYEVHSGDLLKNLKSFLENSRDLIIALIYFDFPYPTKNYRANFRITPNLPCQR